MRMKRRLSWTARLFIAVLLVFSMAMAAFTTARSSLDFGLEDTARSLETSRGRERKQQYEYDEAARQLPLTRAELEEVQPQADAAAEEVRQLKEQRKALRAEKKALEEKAASGNQPEETP